MSIFVDGFKDGKKTVDVSASVASGDRAKGSALGVTFFTMVVEQGRKMATFLQNIVDLSQEGRKAFRVELEARRTASRAQIAEWKATTGISEAMRKAHDSAFSRISEAISFSKAIDAGFNPNMDDGYHVNVGFAVAFMRSAASAQAQGQSEATNGVSGAGPTRKVGRPAKAKLAKAIEYLEKLDLSAAERAELVKALAV